MDAPEVRLSPTGKEAALRYGINWWTCTGTYALLSDRDVEGWTPLLPASTPDRVTCPWCKKPERKLTAAGALRKHGKPNTFPPQDCEGSGLTLDYFEYMQSLGRLHAADDPDGAA